MAFAIEISEVGEPEYPLLERLRETIFSEFGHFSSTPIAAGLAHRHDLYVLMAHLEGNPLGFSVGYAWMPGQFYLNYLGVMKEYRRAKIGLQLLQRQEYFARARGYKQIQFNTFGHFGGMIRLGLAAGYLAVGVSQHAGTRHDLAIRFDKDLNENASPPDRTWPDLEIGAAELRIPSANAASLRQALDAGYSISGIIRTAGSSQPLVIVQKLQSSNR